MTVAVFAHEAKAFVAQPQRAMPRAKIAHDARRIFGLVPPTAAPAAGSKLTFFRR